MVVALSGGPDSVALLHVLYDLREELRLHLEVAHLEHGIRGEEAREDSRFVAALAQNLTLPFHRKEVNIPGMKKAAGKGNMEELARQERYRFLTAVARERKLGKIVTAHTQDDQAETVLMRLLQGAGPRGLGGIAPVRGALVSPLIETRRSEIVAHLDARGLSAAEDASNRDPRFLRARIRHDLLPFMAELTGGSVVEARSER